VFPRAVIARASGVLLAAGIICYALGFPLPSALLCGGGLLLALALALPD